MTSPYLVELQEVTRKFADYCQHKGYGLVGFAAQIALVALLEHQEQWLMGQLEELSQAVHTRAVEADEVLRKDNPELRRLQAQAKTQGLHVELEHGFYRLKSGDQVLAEDERPTMIMAALEKRELDARFSPRN